jgi:hypothetical protein
VTLDQGKTWAENAIDHWHAMEPGTDESAALLMEIMREYRKDLRCKATGGPRRLRPQAVILRRLNRKETRRERRSKFGGVIASLAFDRVNHSLQAQSSSLTSDQQHPALSQCE